MGSVAAAYIFKRLVDLSPAKIDQDYIEILLHNNARVPDRTEGILFGGPSPVPELRRSVDFLSGSGVDYIIFACITSHYFIPNLSTHSTACIIDAVDETAKHLRNRIPIVRKAGIIASTGATQVGLFQKALIKHGIQSSTMTADDQERYFTEPIYADWGVKAGHTTGKPARRLSKAVDLLIQTGCQAIITGCSELPLVLNQENYRVPLVDPIDILVKTSINKCYEKTIYEL